SSCAVNKSTKRGLNVINQFYAAYNEKDFNKLNLIISDKIQLIELNNKVLGSKAAFIDLVECGEVFNSSNSQLSLKESNGKFEATEYEDSDRIQCGT
ncbi:MAG: hypothetical protein MK075_06855, partial [Phycisphaerales bacterium]|nr:hypothetical protein [Phycisphaerales bacterium]